MKKNYYQVRDYNNGELLGYTSNLSNWSVKSAVRVFPEKLTEKEYDFLKRLETALENGEALAENFNSSCEFEYDAPDKDFNTSTWTLFNPHSKEFDENVLKYKPSYVQMIARNLLVKYAKDV